MLALKRYGQTPGKEGMVAKRQDLASRIVLLTSHDLFRSIRLARSRSPGRILCVRWTLATNRQDLICQPANRRLRLCACRPRVSTNRRQTGTWTACPHQRAHQLTDQLLRLASLCFSIVGDGHVSFQVLSARATVELDEQHDIYLRGLQQLGLTADTVMAQQIDDDNL